MLTNRLIINGTRNYSSTEEEASLHNAILVVDSHRRIVSWNRELIVLWGITTNVLATLDDKKVLESVATKFPNPVTCLSDIERIYTQPELELHDVIPLKGNVDLVRYTYPLRFGKLVVGRVWQFSPIETVQK